jgi:hypothetical protein
MRWALQDGQAAPAASYLPVRVRLTSAWAGINWTGTIGRRIRSAHGTLAGPINVLSRVMSPRWEEEN